MKKKESEMNFETAMKKLDSIVEKLEKGNIPLEEALAEFDAGIQLVRYLNKKLDDAERKIELLLKDKDGKIVKREMEFKNGELREKAEDDTGRGEDEIDTDDEEDNREDKGNKTPTLF